MVEIDVVGLLVPVGARLRASARYLGPVLALLGALACSPVTAAGDAADQSDPIPTRPSVSPDLEPGGGLAAPAVEPDQEIAYPPEWRSRAEVPFQSDPRPAKERPEIDLTSDLILPEPLLFTTGSAVLTVDADIVLEPLAAQAVGTLGAGQQLTIDGYVDQQGDDLFNEALAQDRADAVALRLVRFQPALERRLVAAGHGEDDLLHPDCPVDCSANRAVVIGIAR
jgi:outer membrane protein OmpA-like peptidoglycan-associated protein